MYKEQIKIYYNIFIIRNFNEFDKKNYNKSSDSINRLSEYKSLNAILLP